MARPDGGLRLGGKTTSPVDVYIPYVSDGSQGLNGGGAAAGQTRHLDAYTRLHRLNENKWDLSDLEHSVTFVAGSS
jgi:hypothetical protein